MKRIINILTMAGLFALVGFPVFSGGRIDVVGNDSVRSFRELLQNAPQLVTEDATNGGWSISAPDNGARFIWSKNFASSPRFDVMLEIDAAPFIDAGLNPALLPGNFVLAGNKLTVGTKLGNEQLQYQGQATAIASYEHIVKLKRQSIGYHGAADHYGVNLGNGNLFEWAKELKTNDKDIVFVLDPDALIRAGVDPDRINGWLFAKVTVDDENGRPVEVDKLLKPFDLL